jgi:non-ribosomal peptide synthetase component F
VIVPENTLRDPDKFIDLLAREGLTRIVLVPSLLRTVLDRLKDSAQRLANLHHWACSGEALSASLVRDFYAHLPDAQLFNIYGTSEVWDATWFVTRRELNGASVPIGLPIANMRALVLDANFEPVPPNVTGELFIGGVGLARGYLGRPGLTADRFLPDPFGHGDRLYRTGDLARRRPDGVIEFVGRRDDQVKLRGHRIELSEIQTVIQSHPNVRNAVVVLRYDLPSGDPALVAYVVGSALPTVSALRTHVQDRLPSHMVPAHFLIMAELPLTPNGKIDRAKLPSPQPQQVTARKHVAPKSDTEKMLAGIWAQVLGSQNIGIDDNFFELGGDSLMLLRVQTAINERVHQDIPATVLFRFATIRALSGYLTDGQRSDLLVRSRNRGEARKKFLTRQVRGLQPPRLDQ